MLTVMFQNSHTCDLWPITAIQSMSFHWWKGLVHDAALFLISWLRMCLFQCIQMLLNFWKWDLNYSTSLDFLEHYLSCDLLKCAEGLHTNSLNNFKCQTVYLANLMLSEANFIFFKSSIIAASCIVVARTQFKLHPSWSNGMEILTGYSYVEIDECVQHLVHLAQASQNECFFNHLQQQPPTLIREELRADCKWKLKGVSNHICARTKRKHLIHPRDLKQMYRLTDCAM